MIAMTLPVWFANKAPRINASMAAMETLFWFPMEIISDRRALSLELECLGCAVHALPLTYLYRDSGTICIIRVLHLLGRLVPGMSGDVSRFLFQTFFLDFIYGIQNIALFYLRADIGDSLFPGAILSHLIDASFAKRLPSIWPNDT